MGDTVDLYIRTPITVQTLLNGKMYIYIRISMNSEMMDGVGDRRKPVRLPDIGTLHHKMLLL